MAIAPSLPPISGPGGCGAPDVVRLEAVVLADKTRIPLTPPATLRCSMAEAVVKWVREDVTAAVHKLGGVLKSIDNYDSFDCRGRNNIPGAKLSEHGRANALDIRSFKLSDGRVLRLVDPHVPRDFREGLRRSVCERFSTVLGPGSDGYHEDHVHLDLMERARGHMQMCEWDIRDPAPAAPVAAAAAKPAGAATVPLPIPRPRLEKKNAAQRHP